MSHGGGGDRWLVSYADFITLLMVLFVVLYSMSQVDVEKYKTLANSLRVAFSGGEGEPSVIDPKIDLGGGIDENTSAAPIIIPGLPSSTVDEVEVAGELTDMLASTGSGGMVSVQNNMEGVLISMSEKLIFSPGTADLSPDAYPVLDLLAEMLHKIDNDVRVIGYTDDSQPIDPRYTNNWELSMARALQIVQYLVSHGVEPERLEPAGRGEYQPLFYNDSDEHRALNSRAEIIVIYPLVENLIDIGLENHFDVAPDVEPDIEIPDADTSAPEESSEATH